MINGLRPLRFLFALMTAPLLWLAFPGGGGLWPLLALALLPFFLVLRACNARRAALLGLAVGTLHYLLLLYWIVNVLGRYGGLPLIASVPALMLLTLYMAGYWAVFAICARYVLCHLSFWWVLLALPALWVGLDWLRSWLFSGFPWMDLGYALAQEPKMIQIADLFGHGSLTYLVVLLNSFFALLILNRQRLSAVLPIVLPVTVVIGAVFLYSQMRWQQLARDLSADQHRSIVTGIVQGNIDQSLKWSPTLQQQTVQRYLNTSRQLFTDARPQLLVWPETALPFYPLSYKGFSVLQAFVAQYDTAILSGAPWYEVVDSKNKDIRFYNSAQLLEERGEFTGSYYKSHLVPYGEYVPLKRFMPFLEPLVEAVGDFHRGTVEKPLVRQQARIGVLICFESIFPELARQWVLHGANMLVNLTNDAWYGKSSAPYQSMNMTILRAVETRRSVVRSANTGVSGFIDPLGRVIQPSSLFVIWAGAQNVALLEGMTHYVRWGYRFPQVCLLLGMLFSGYAILRAGKQ